MTASAPFRNQPSLIAAHARAHPHPQALAPVPVALRAVGQPAVGPDIRLFDADDCLRLHDRRKDMLNCGEFDIHPGDLGAVLRPRPAVADGAEPSAEWSETPVAFCVRKPGTADSAEDLRVWAYAEPSSPSNRYSSKSPGWHCSTWQMRCSVSKRTPRTLPLLSSEMFCSVMPTAAARSRDFIFRLASMTSRFTMMAI
jgi:hypothetical protein